MTRRTIAIEWGTLDWLHEYGINVDRREIFLHGYVDLTDEEPGVDYRMAQQFIKNIRCLELDSSKPILVHSITCGGEWTYGMAIFDAIR